MPQKLLPAGAILLFVLSVLIPVCPAQDFVEGKASPAPGRISFQNSELEKMQRTSYDQDSLVRLKKVLARHNTLVLKRYASGGHSAVTVTDPASLQSAIGDLLILHWDRDNIMQALSEQAIGAVSANKDAQAAWKDGLIASLKHHHQNRNRFVDVIADPAVASDFMRRPHIRYNPVNFNEIKGPWGHAQNDALSSVAFLLFYSLNRNKLSWNDKSIQPYAQSYAVMLPNYFRAIKVWQDQDLGAWEDKKAEHASSIGTAVAALREELDFLNAHGALQWSDGNSTYTVTADDVRDLLTRSEARLREILPNEFIKSDNGEIRNTDAALVNALFLGAIAGRPLVDDAMSKRIIDCIEQQLMGDIGINRYENDVWDGRINRTDLRHKEEAQWCHVSPMLCFILGEMFRRTGDRVYLEKQTDHFNRSLAHVTNRWRIPEAYIIDPASRKWVPDANEPLAWAQAVTVLAYQSMEQSLEFSCRAKSRKPPAAKGSSAQK